MTTYRELAAATGRSKPTIIAACNDIDPAWEHREKHGNRVEVDAWLASAVAARLGSARTAASATTAAADVPANVLEAIREGYEARLEERAARIQDLQEQIGRLEREVAEARADARDARAELERERVAGERRERELALARALEGWHWPWQRRQILARYALPAEGGTSSES